MSDLRRANSSSIVLAISVAVATTSSLGCADDARVMISGKATCDGAPIAQGTIGFFPADGKGPSAEAVIENGNYAVSLARGTKEVIIHGYKKVGEHFPWGKENPPAEILKEIVPDQFNAKSQLRIEISEDRNDVDFELDSEVE